MCYWCITIYCDFFQRAFCAFCRDRIWGLGRQGFKCTTCKLLIHKKCHKLIRVQCDPNTPWPPRQPSGTGSGSGASTGERGGSERQKGPNGANSGNLMLLSHLECLWCNLKMGFRICVVQNSFLTFFIWQWHKTKFKLLKYQFQYICKWSTKYRCTRSTSILTYISKQISIGEIVLS